MIDEAAARELAQRAVAEGIAAGAKARGTRSPNGYDIQAEAIIVAQRSALTRFSDFVIHQNVADDSQWLSLRVIVDKRTGVATTNSLDPARFGDVAHRAAQFAVASPADPDFESLPEPIAVPRPDHDLWFESTAASSPADRAAIVKTMFEMCRQRSVAPAGSVSVEDAVIAVSNSLGVDTACRATETESSLVCTAGGGETGWAESVERDITRCDAAALVARAADKALAAQDAQSVAPGPWTVVLEPAAVAELLGLLSYCGFGALAEQEGQSFLSGRLGEKITGEEITIVDDAADERTVALPFDFEGVPRRRVPLITDGVAVGVVHDSYTAARVGTESTGHALPAPNTHGPLATDLVMSPGDSSLEDLVAGTDKGLLVTRFFYTNPLDPRRTLITGMTRDGLYRIENGEIAGAAKNLRVSESVLEALSRVTGLSAAMEKHRCILGTAVAPAARIEQFNFSSGTDF